MCWEGAPENWKRASALWRVKWKGAGSLVGSAQAADGSAGSWNRSWAPAWLWMDFSGRQGLSSPGCRHRLKSLLCSFAEFSVVPGDKSLGFAAERLSLEHAWVSGSNPSRCRLLPRVIPSQINRVSSSQELGFISGAPRRSSVSTARLERCRSTLDFRRNPPSVCPFAHANRG